MGVSFCVHTEMSAEDGATATSSYPGLIDTQVARDVVNGNEQAYEEIAKYVPRRRSALCVFLSPMIATLFGVVCVEFCLLRRISCQR